MFKKFEFNELFNKIADGNKINEIRNFAITIIIFIIATIYLYMLSWENTSIVFAILSIGLLLMFMSEILGIFLSIRKHTSIFNNLIEDKLLMIVKHSSTCSLLSKIDNREYKFRNCDTVKYELELLNDFNEYGSAFWNKMYLSAKFGYDGALSIFGNKLCELSEKLELIIPCNKLYVKNIKIIDDNNLYEGYFYNVESDGNNLNINLYNISDKSVEYEDFKNLYLLLMHNSVGYLDILIDKNSIRIEGIELEKFKKFIIEFYEVVEKTIDKNIR